MLWTMWCKDVPRVCRKTYRSVISWCWFEDFRCNCIETLTLRIVITRAPREPVPSDTRRKSEQILAEICKTERLLLVKSLNEYQQTPTLTNSAISLRIYSFLIKRFMGNWIWQTWTEKRFHFKSYFKQNIARYTANILLESERSRVTFHSFFFFQPTYIHSTYTYNTFDTHEC